MKIRRALSWSGGKNTELSASDFDGRKLKRPETIAVLFTADWCPFCQKFSSLFESVLEEKGLLRAIVDLSDLENPIWEIFDVRVVPTVIIFKEGQPVFRNDGILGRGLSKEILGEIVQRISGGQSSPAS